MPNAAAERIPPLERTLPALLVRQAALYGDRILFRAGDVAWRYADMPGVAARSAGRLLAAGVAAGDRVAIMSGNRAEFLELFLGCAWMGAIAVPVNVASRGPQLQHVLDNSGARLLVVEPGLAAALATVDLGALTVWRIEALPPAGGNVPPVAAGPGDTVAILYTSGTTGPSKGVCCPQAQMLWWGFNTAALLGVGPGDVLCTTLPLFHTNALNTFYQALLHGATMVVERRFSASRFWQAMAQSGASVTYLLGAMVPILLSRPVAAEERAHRVRIALAPGVPAQFHEAFTERTGVRLLDGYGSTETNFVIGTTIEHQRPGTMGPVAPGFEAQVVDALDNPLPDGTPGELVLRAEAPFAFATGYWGMPEKTVEAWRNLRFHTGDRVVRDADGYFRFVDRMKDAIRRRGENISAYEVEQVLLAHPQVANAAVFPVRADMAEDEVMAAVVPAEGGAPAPEELIAHCTRLLPYFAVPRYLEFADALPVTENGKVRKYVLIERGVTAATWDRTRGL
ncbi:ATP-dependent acyl-CoA ligase [Limobrevibacterium gyesilva]|uniref:ATP-dependent acyl-CoA ligase n=1 Tax=Limobrevibacterium gyesilva TaxID=2991712 RepID=A0AA42CEA5_9PROT|nr:ATP-dependent acyl-CoA ligase [Limobrevibacterium gyesilva]MCW3475818.1 ATP-dependent acyl-CoA ligase [Limobrevibacterium gyesilva]